MGKRDELSVEDRGIFDAMRGLGLSESAAFEATVGRGERLSVIADPFEHQVDTFRRLGLSEEVARAAAVGRADSEHHARQDLLDARRIVEEASKPGVPTIDVDAFVKAVVDKVEKAYTGKKSPVVRVTEADGL